MKTNDRMSRVASGSPLRVGGHLKDAWLLLAVDGELSASDAEVVNRHLESCWRCRARKETIERTIGGIVEYEKLFAAAAVKPGSDGTALFVARLNHLASELDRSTPSRASRFLQTLRGRISPPLVYAAAMVLLVTGLLYMSFLRKTPAVSASEILHKAESSELTALHQVSEPVVVQQVRIKVANRSETRTIYRDLVHGREVQRIDISSKDDSAAHQEFEKSSLSWNDPLSPERYQQWWSSVAQKQDKINRLDGNLIRLDTTAESGPIADTSLLLRSEDYHPIAESLHLRDNTRIEIAELSYDVVGLSSLAPGIFGVPNVQEVAKSIVLPASRAMIAVHAEPFQLAASELAVEVALHAVNADLGEQISVNPGSNGVIEVSGVADSAARKQQILAALHGVPFTDVNIRSVDEIAVREEVTVSLAPPPTTAPSIMEMAPPLLAQELNTRFTDDEIRTRYVNNTLALCQDASAHTWALVRLAKQFDAEKVDLLNSGAREQLQGILAEHVASLREEIKELRAQLEPFMKLDSVPPSDISTANVSTGAFPDDDWRASADALHLSEAAVGASVDALFAGSTSSGTTSAQSEESALSAALLQLQSKINMFDRQVRFIPSEKASTN